MNKKATHCAVVAEVTSSSTLDITATSTLEFHHALDRCLKRIELAIEGHKGKAHDRADHGIDAVFLSCDDAVMASCEMLDRVATLPPYRGKRFSVRIGMHFGDTDTDPDDTLKVAHRLASSAQLGQAFASDKVILQLSATTRHLTQTLSSHTSPLRDFDGPVHVIERSANAVRRRPPSATSKPSPAPIISTLSQRLRLHHQGKIFMLDDSRPILLLGREFGNDLVISDPRASRQHARIERRRGGFVLMDHSTNGTYLSNDQAKEQCVKGDESVISGSGKLGCGFSTKELERDLVLFEAF